MHVPQDSMWRRILKSFWFLGWTKQGLKQIKDLFSFDLKTFHIEYLDIYIKH